MKIDVNDPKWTAYVLGELDDADRIAIEQLLASSEEARTLVEELRIATMALHDELKNELAGQMTAALLPAQKAVVRNAANATKRRWFTRPAVWAAGLAAAAVVVAALVIPARIDHGVRRDVLTVPESSNVTPPAQMAAVFPPDKIAKAPAGPRSMPTAPSSPDIALAPGVSAQIQVENKAAERAELAETAKDSIGTVNFTPSAASTPAGIEEVKVVTGPLDTEVSKSSPMIPLPVPGRTGGRGGAAPANAPVSGGAVAGIRDGVGGALSRDIRGGLVIDPGIMVAPLSAEARAGSPLPILPPRPDAVRRLPQQPNTEAYDPITDNPFRRVSDEPLATFSSDVDTASYSNMRRFLNNGQLPPKDSVRIEEMVNYFSYDYPQPTGQQPIAAQMEIASAPWNAQHRLVRVGIKAKDMDASRRPVSNLVFLIDVSGSMQPAERLPLLKNSMRMLIDKLSENDLVSIVVYAGASGVVLPPTTGDRKDAILQAIDRLQAGGSTNGGSGIQLAYNLAAQHYVRGGVNRVILATDGDFNVGVTNQGDLLRLIEDKAKTGVFLTVLGFGIGNLKDSTLEKLADAGNGNYAYIDTLNEARKVLIDQMSSTFVTVAKDVKIQVEFNPAQVNAYRLIGYENRVLQAQDFNNDLKDAGDMGAGHSVTALFEVVPKGVDFPAPGIDPLKYQAPAAPRPVSNSREMLTLKVRYKDPEGSQSRLLEVPLEDRGAVFARASGDFQFAASVAAFGMILRDSPYKGTATLGAVLDMAEGSRGADRTGYRQEFIGLVRRAQSSLAKPRYYDSPAPVIK